VVLSSAQGKSSSIFQQFWFGIWETYLPFLELLNVISTTNKTKLCLCQYTERLESHFLFLIRYFSWMERGIEICIHWKLSLCVYVYLN